MSGSVTKQQGFTYLGNTTAARQRRHARSRSMAACCSSEAGTQPLQRRCLLQLAASVGLAAALPPIAEAAAAALPQGYRLHEDKLDGYSFRYPTAWIPVTTSGNDTLYRNPRNVNENLFVNLTSPSSSRYRTVEDIGSPQSIAGKLQRQYLQEMMSTRLGVRRQAEIISAALRQGQDGCNYCDVQMDVRSYASRNQLAVTQKEVDQGLELEWERRLITVLGVANSRLYEFRLQTASSTWQDSSDYLLSIAQSFQCKGVS